MKNKTNHLYLLFILTLMISSCGKEIERSEKSSKKYFSDLENAIVVDLSYTYSDETIYWVTAKEFELDTVFAGETEKGYYYSANNFSGAEHGGTHIDAPIHFSRGKKTVDQIPLEKLIGQAVKVDVSEKALKNPDYLVGKQDFVDWEKKHGIEIGPDHIVLVQTGHSAFYADAEKYLGTDQRGEDAVKLLHFPGLSSEAAHWLAKKRVKAVGIDTPSIDYGQSELFESHVVLLSENIPAFENLASLDQLPDKGFDIIALPMKIKGGSGGPLRIIALIPK